MDNIKRRVGAAIRQARTKKGLTQKELAKKICSSDSLISRYESGKQNPTLATLGKIGLALGVYFDIVVN